MAEKMRSLETGRLITLVTHAKWAVREGLDFCDFIAYNSYAGSGKSYTRTDYLKGMKEGLDRSYEPIRSFYPDKPLVITEFGTVCIAGLRGSEEDGHMTEDYAGRYVETLAEALMENPNLRGLVLWCYADYKHERGFFTGNGMHLAATAGPYGVVTQDRRQKPVFTESFRRTLALLEEKFGDER